MAYCTQQDLIDRFGAEELIQLTDRSNVPPTTIDPTVVDRALTDAQALADGYIGTVYVVPLASVPAVLTKLTADVARYFLYGNSAIKDSPVEIAYRDALAWLTGVSKSLVTIADATTIPAQLGGGQVRTNAGDERVVSNQSMRGFV